MAVTASVLGLAGVDKELAPALPPGWIGLVLGQSGSGMALLAKQFAQSGSRPNTILYYTTYERTEDARKAFADFGWSFEGIHIVNLSDEFYERVLRRDLEVSRLRERGLSFKDLTDTSVAPARRRTYNLTNRVLSDLAALDAPFRLVLDSVDFFLEVLDPGEVLTMIRQVRHRVQSLGGEALFLLQSDVHDRRTTGLVEDLADLVVELRTDSRREPVEHLFTVRKVRNHPEKVVVGQIRVTPSGLAIVPKGTPNGAASDVPPR